MQSGPNGSSTRQLVIASNNSMKTVTSLTGPGINYKRGKYISFKLIFKLDWTGFLSEHSFFRCIWTAKRNCKVGDDASADNASFKSKYMNKALSYSVLHLFYII